MPSDQLLQVSHVQSKWHLRFSSMSALVVPVTQRLWLGAFHAATTREWNNLPSKVTATLTLPSFELYLLHHYHHLQDNIRGRWISTSLTVLVLSDLVVYLITLIFSLIHACVYSNRL